jgi:Fe-S-cluster containining protein
MSPWYEDGIRFACQRCGECCRTHGEHAFVYLNRQDTQRIAEQLDLSRTHFLLAHCVQEDDNWSYLRPAGIDCRLLDDAGRCRVYPVRPLQCATWPFWSENLEPEVWNGPVVETCPGIGQGRLYSRAEIERLAAERDRWFEN